MKTLKVVSLATFRLKLKKVGKITRPFRCDLNQILYYYTVEVTNRFMGLDLIECLMNYGAKLNKSLIQFSVDWQGSVPSLLFDLRPNSGGGGENNGDLLQ